MRLWHIDLITNGLLPKSQLLAQWRELNSIFKKQDKHILINYIYDTDKYWTNANLWEYTMAVILEMQKRNYEIKSLANADNYFEGIGAIPKKIKYLARYNEHNNEYLLICFMNLYEKYIRGQKDFDKATFNKLYDFVNTKFNLKILGIEKE